MNLQDTFLGQLRKDKSEIIIYLVNGFQLKGIITGYDNFTILLENAEGKPQMVYKHAITTVHPIRGMNRNFLEDALRSAPGRKSRE